MYKIFFKIKSIFCCGKGGVPAASLEPSLGVHPERAQASLLSGSRASCARCEEYKNVIVTLLNMGDFKCHVSWDSETNELTVSEGEDFDPWKSR